MAATYLDSSALVKLVIREPESAALRRFLSRGRTAVSSALARTEVTRAVLAEGDRGLALARQVLASVDLIRVSDRVLNAAGELLPENLRSLDAIHLATARLLGSDLAQLVAYDARLLDAAKTLGLKTVAPH